MHRLDFTQVHTYANDDQGVAVPVILRSGKKQIQLVASIDTGASFCLFASELADLLGLELTAGEPKRFRTANSTLEAFGHEIEITAVGVATYTMVYFFADPFIRKNVLGRAGWLDRVRLGLVHYDSKIYLSSYNLE